MKVSESVDRQKAHLLEHDFLMQLRVIDGAGGDGAFKAVRDHLIEKPARLLRPWAAARHGEQVERQGGSYGW